ncbi:hypothetical protein Gohar_018471 [Gossypium harknessii]|uniref:Uncharacterized protein n=1 Tax=Gossypium harknessii TaxID=34285 RepID=A0A7J9G987_9ROSI|nr:hypothetical protein [Gossypium harknessii]
MSVQSHLRMFSYNSVYQWME